MKLINQINATIGTITKKRKQWYHYTEKNKETQPSVPLQKKNKETQTIVSQQIKEEKKPQTLLS